MFALNGQLLAGDSPQGIAVGMSPSANHNGEIEPKFLVFHYTACNSAAARAAFMRQSGSNRVSAHLLVDRDGSVTQFVPFNLRAWHAGESRWDGFQDLNSHSIGIEVVDYGYLLKGADGSFRTAEGLQTVAPADVIEAHHRLPQWPWQYWQAFSPEQIATCEALATLLVDSYRLRDVLGHDDIAPDRKADPGPAFPMQRIRGLALGRDSHEVAEKTVYVAVEKLNIRTGPGTANVLAGAPLMRNMQLTVLDEDTPGWAKVRTQQLPPVEGWVSSQYVATKVT